MLLLLLMYMNLYICKWHYVWRRTPIVGSLMKLILLWWRYETLTKEEDEDVTMIR